MIIVSIENCLLNGDNKKKIYIYSPPLLLVILQTINSNMKIAIRCNFNKMSMLFGNSCLQNFTATFWCDISENIY